MKSPFAEHSIYIIAGQVISRTFSESMKLVVIQGKVWITLSGIRDDFWLHAGESLVLEAGRFTVIEADRENSTIELAPAGKVHYGKIADNADKKSSSNGNWIWDVVRG